MATARHHGHGIDRSALRFFRWLRSTGRRTCATFMNSVERISNSPVKANEPIAYLIPAGQSRDEAVAKLVGSLIDQGVEVFRLDSELHVILWPTDSTADKPSIARNSERTEDVANTDSPCRKCRPEVTSFFLSQPQRTNVLALVRATESIQTSDRTLVRLNVLTTLLVGRSRSKWVLKPQP